MAFNPDIQEYLNLLNQITQSTFSTQMEEGLKYIKEHFSARGLSASGAIQDAIQQFTTKHASAMTLAQTRNAALAWQLQSARNTQQESQKWYEKQQEQGRQDDYGMQNWAAVDAAMNDQSENFRQERNRPSRASSNLPGHYSNYPDSYFEPGGGYDNVHSVYGGATSSPVSVNPHAGLFDPTDVLTPGVYSGGWAT